MSKNNKEFNWCLASNQQMEYWKILNGAQSQSFRSKSSGLAERTGPRTAPKVEQDYPVSPRWVQTGEIRFSTSVSQGEQTGKAQMRLADWVYLSTKHTSRSVYWAQAGVRQTWILGTWRSSHDHSGRQTIQRRLVVCPGFYTVWPCGPDHMLSTPVLKEGKKRTSTKGREGGGTADL